MRELPADLLATFGGLADELDEEGGWDEIILSPSHLTRMQAQALLTHTGLPANGVLTQSHPAVPEGIGILKNHGKVVGIMDFSARAITFLARSKHGRKLNA
jgi:hypothetical protein